MVRLPRWGILPRSAFTISLIAISAGLVSIGITLTVMSDRAGKIANQELGQLIDTVESTVQIACFVEDHALAAEVVRGLLKNTKISGVSIRAGLIDLATSYRNNVPDKTALNKLEAGRGYQHAPLVRSVSSPFDPTQVVGEITLLPDHEGISDTVYKDLEFLGLILALQWLITGVGMLVLILSTVIRPIKLISDQLHRMEIEVENGEHLTAPRGHENTEIGRLVDDINLLSSRLNVLIRHAKDQTEYLSEAKLKDDVLTKQLAEQNVALARAMQIQEEVERIARHDLKTPLNSIATVPALLRLSRVFTPEEDALLTIVEDSAKRVLRMVSLSFDLFRMEEGLYILHAQPVDLAALVLHISKELSEEARSRAVTFKYIGAELPVYIRGEEILCYSILANVMKNAVEAVPVGGEVQIRIVNAKKVWLSINNPGVVPLGIRQRFFEKYVSSGKIGGTGLGTYSARLMARTQNGDLQMKTSESDGTTLTLELNRWKGPVIATPSKNPDLLHASNSKAKLPALRVLIVDDDPNNTLIMKMLLPSPPLIVATACNGAEALQWCEGVRPDIIFMDLEMPVMNGYEAIKAIRLLQNNQDVLPSFVVAFSAHDDEISRMRSLDLGFDKHLSKPSSQAEIFALIAGCNLPKDESEQHVVRQDEALIWVDHEIKDIVPEFIASRLVLLLEARQIVEEENRGNLRQLMHKLKGSFMLYGFKWAAETCCKIEDNHEIIDFITVNEQILALEQHLLKAEIRMCDHNSSNVN